MNTINFFRLSVVGDWTQLIKPEHLPLIGPDLTWTSPNTFVVTLHPELISEERLEEIGYDPGIRSFEDMEEESWEFMGGDQGGATLATRERPYELYVSAEFTPDEIREMIQRCLDGLNSAPWQMDEPEFTMVGSGEELIWTEEYIAVLERGECWKRDLRFEVA